jgi:putative NADH-flavin reductase
MKVTVFGGTGRSGRPLVEQALAAGHDVTILVRDPAKVSTQNPRLVVVKGDVQDATAVAQAISEAEAVLSVLGPTHNRPTFDVSSGMDNIIAAMRKAEARRLIISAGAGVADPNDAPGLFDRAIGVLLKVMARNVYEDMVQTVAKVRASDLDWTVVRVPMLTDGPHTGKVKTGSVGKGVGARLSRADMADFMLGQLTDDRYVRRSPAISN